MKNTLKNLAGFLMLFVFAIGCQDDDSTFGDVTTPTNLELSYEIVGRNDANPNGDGSGMVILKADADNATTYKFIYPDGSSDTKPSGIMNKRFTTNGINSYLITVVAYGTGGSASTGTMTVVDLFSLFDDPETTRMLTNGSTKTWYWSAAEQSHLGVGPNAAADTEHNFWPFWYGAGAFEKAGGTSSCLYGGKFTFALEGSQIKFVQDNGGSTFFNKAFSSLAGGNGSEDICLPYDTTGQKNVLLSPAESVVAPEHTTGTQMTISSNGFMGYYIGTSTYEILDISENRMVVRAVQGNDPATAWYQTFTTQDPNAPAAPVFTNLVWQDEFNVDGAPDASKWTPELGGGGWGNQEQQVYKAENATVSGGTLKITAKKESDGTYTSARLITHNKKDFTYGMVEIRAKLPSGAGTWPALWMLGSNYTSNPWPGCGEIDMMESVGRNPDVISSTLHYPGHSGGEGDTTSKNVSGISTDFHIYTLVWNADSLKFYVRANEADPLPAPYKIFTNPGAPFTSNFFLIFNVAMGGTLGGTIDPGFTQSSMEVDYVRLYQ